MKKSDRRKFSDSTLFSEYNIETCSDSSSDENNDVYYEILIPVNSGSLSNPVITEHIEIIEEDTEIEEIMDDISIKLDSITEKYNSKVCNKLLDNISDIMYTFNEQWEDLMKIVVKGLPHMYYSGEEDNTYESSSDEDSSKED